MNLAQFRDYCMKKKGVTDGYPFGEGVLVLKVAGKMFALATESAVPLGINLKCDPERAVELRERYEAVQPGYHMNKKYWNTVTLDGTIPAKEVKELIDHSYDLVVAGLSKKERALLEG